MTRCVLRPWSMLLLGLVLAPALAQTETIVFSPYEQQDIAISKALFTATHSIDMALYSISPESDWVEDPGPDASQPAIERWKAFRAQLEAGDVKPFDMIRWKSQEKGVRCRLILHRAALDPWSIDAANRFRDVGVEVRWIHKTMHHKFAIVDGKILINGSGNWSRGAAERYSENTVIYEGHTGLVRQFAAEFRYLWDTLLAEGRASVFDPALLPIDPVPPSSFFVERQVWHSWTAPIEAYFTSENRNSWEYTCADKIISEMRRARRSITIMINHFNMGRISNALIQVHRQKNKNADPSDDVKIQVLMDLGEFDAGNIGVSRARELEQAGIEVRYKAFSLSFYYPKAQFMHHKVMVIDSERMVTGSYNWSTTGEHKNYENITVHQGPTQQALIDAVEGEFQGLWEARRDLLPDFRAAVLSKPGDEGYRRYVPVHFSGSYYKTIMTLTRAEIESFRKPLEAMGYRPAVEGDEEATNNHAYRYFDKETGTFTDVGPGDTFVRDEHVIRGPATTDAATEAGPAPAITPATPPPPPTTGIVGELPVEEPVSDQQE